MRRSVTRIGLQDFDYEIFVKCRIPLQNSLVVERLLLNSVNI